MFMNARDNALQIEELEPGKVPTKEHIDKIKSQKQK